MFSITVRPSERSLLAGCCATSFIRGACAMASTKPLARASCDSLPGTPPISATSPWPPSLSMRQRAASWPPSRLSVPMYVTLAA